ncbi:MAG TPA: endonuclease/exonuclease/phosphatase family protein [Thermoanaerobaculia bacterium]|nr:endonuclease/exonuclease/phosphatase family protein [Thermoanaerobaculia bacterium]
MDFRVLSYNIHRAIGVDRLFRPERVANIIRYYAPDVVLLQEVDEGVPRSRELNLASELAAALGFEHYKMGANVSLRKGHYGNATLSRFPIVRERNIDLTIGSRKRRGCQHTTLAIDDGSHPGRMVEVFNLHLGLSAREREQQAGILVRSGEFPPLGEGPPCIVGGDFNDWRSRLRPIFTEVFCFDCATEGTSGTSVPMKTYPSFSPRGALDRFYFRDLELVRARRCRLALSKVASDHLPIVADFRLARR